MRTISDKLSKRLSLQAKEAEVQGLEKVASNLKRVADGPVRKDAAFYVYSKDQLMADLEQPLWDALIRVADYYQCHFDAAQAQDVIESLASSLVKEMQSIGNVSHGVGAFEPQVPGEEKLVPTIEIDDE